MGRPPRPQFAGATYHVTSRGAARGAIFRDDRDREIFLRLLERVVRRHSWRCSAYCLLSTHYHLLVTTVAADIGAGMRELNGHFARHFNKRHGRSGALFESRYRCEVVGTDSHLLEVYRYLALNPVRAGIVERPEDWEWASYPGHIGAGPLRSFVQDDPVLALFGRRDSDARIRFKGFVDSAPVSDTD
jgi:putative transposase